MAMGSDSIGGPWADAPCDVPPPEVQQHRNALRACAQRLLGDSAEAEAVVDEALECAGHAIALFRPPGSLGGWLQGVTIGLALARLRATDRIDRSREETHTAPRSRDRSAVVAVDRVPLRARRR
jgi:DNA-directed RNA polymerase specialized sigma24 family protein